MSYSNYNIVLTSHCLIAGRGSNSATEGDWSLVIIRSFRRSSPKRCLRSVFISFSWLNPVSLTTDVEGNARSKSINPRMFSTPMPSNAEFIEGHLTVLNWFPNLVIQKKCILNIFHGFSRIGPTQKRRHANKEWIFLAISC